jgi:hypothetical protein
VTALARRSYSGGTISWSPSPSAQAPSGTERVTHAYLQQHLDENELQEEEEHHKQSSKAGEGVGKRKGYGADGERRRCCGCWYRRDERSYASGRVLQRV